MRGINTAHRTVSQQDGCGLHRPEACGGKYVTIPREGGIGCHVGHGDAPSHAESAAADSMAIRPQTVQLLDKVGIETSLRDNLQFSAIAIENLKVSLGGAAGLNGGIQQIGKSLLKIIPLSFAFITNYNPITHTMLAMHYKYR